MTGSKTLVDMEAEFRPLLLELEKLQRTIHAKLFEHSCGKTLKGNELVGWLGEIYGASLLAGTLVDDSQEHDFETPTGRRVSVKTRKGSGRGWQKTSAIPKIDGPTCPTDLLFVHLADDYSIGGIWLFDWAALYQTGRFKSHVVRGMHRSFIFTLNPSLDQVQKIYPKDNLPAT